MAESIKSRYKPEYPKKYKGDPNNIICRSSWERKFCRWCDLNESILEWGSEEFFVKYFDQLQTESENISQILLLKFVSNLVRLKNM